MLAVSTGPFAGWTPAVACTAIAILCVTSIKQLQWIVQGSRDGSTEKYANKGRDDSGTKVIPTFFPMPLKFRIKVK